MPGPLLGHSRAATSGEMLGKLSESIIGNDAREVRMVPDFFCLNMNNQLNISTMKKMKYESQLRLYEVLLKKT